MITTRLLLSPKRNQLAAVFEPRSNFVIVELDSRDGPFTVTLPSLSDNKNRQFIFLNAPQSGYGYLVTITGRFLNYEAQGTVRLPANKSTTLIDTGRGSWITTDAYKTRWNDLLPNAVETVSSGANAAGFTSFNGGNLKAYEFVGTGPTIKEIFIGWQVSHGVLYGSVLRPHIHIHIPTDVTGGIVKFYMEYEFASVNETGSITPVTLSGTETVSASAAISNNKKLTFGDITVPDGAISALITARIYRDPADAGDTFGSSVWVKGADIHCELVDHGSKQEYIQ